MARLVPSWLRAFGRACFRVVRDSFFVRHLVSIIALWPRSRFLSVVFALSVLGCVWLAASTGRVVFDVLRPSASGPLWPGVAAAFAVLAMLELACASLMGALRALLRLSLDTGRHRIGVLLTIAAVAGVAWGARGTFVAPASSGPALAIWPAVATVLLAGAFWFERAYRRPAYPGFRDFQSDIVDARRHLSRAAHGG